MGYTSSVWLAIIAVIMSMSLLMVGDVYANGISANSNEYELYYGFERSGIIGGTLTRTNDIAYDHINNRIILTDNTLSDTSAPTIQIYDPNGTLVGGINVPLCLHSSVDYDPVNNRILVGGVNKNYTCNNIFVYDGSTLNKIDEYNISVTDIAYDRARGKILATIIETIEGSQVNYERKVVMIDESNRSFTVIHQFDDCPFESSTRFRPMGLLYDGNDRIFVFCNTSNSSKMYIMKFREGIGYEVQTSYNLDGPIELAYDRNHDRLLIGYHPNIIKAYDARSDIIDFQNPIFTLRSQYSTSSNASKNNIIANSLSQYLTYDNNYNRIIVAGLGLEVTTSSTRSHEVIYIFVRDNTKVTLLEGENLSDGTLQKVGDSIIAKVETEHVGYDKITFSWNTPVSLPQSREEFSNLFSYLSRLNRSYNPSYYIGTGGEDSQALLFSSREVNFTESGTQRTHQETFKPFLPGEWRLIVTMKISQDKINNILNTFSLGGFVNNSTSIPSIIPSEGLKVRVLTGIFLSTSNNNLLLSGGNMRLGDSITAKIITIDGSVVKAKFTWIRPDGSTAVENVVNVQEITNPVTGKSAEDTFTPDIAGDGWKVRVELQDNEGNTLYVEEATFNVKSSGGGGTGGGGGGGEVPTYILELSSGDGSPLPDNGNRYLGNSITASIRTNVGTVNNVIFRWLYNTGNENYEVIREQLLPISDGRANDIFIPNRAGTWKVVVEFRHDNNILATKEIRFMINPVNQITVGGVNNNTNITLAINDPFRFSSLPTVSPPPSQLPTLPNVVVINIPYGLLSFAVDSNDSSNGWLILTINYPSPLPSLNSNQQYAYIKNINEEWRLMDTDSTNENGYFEIINNTTIKLHIKDNGRFDADNAIGRVNDPGGIVIIESQSSGGGGGGGQPPNAKVRAIQGSNSLDENNPGVLGQDIWCVGGIDSDSQANDIHCYLLPDGVPTHNYNTDPSVIKRDGDSSNIATCPDGAGFQPTDICFWVLFPASDFPTAGHYRFVAEFTKDGNTIDLAGIDYRVHSFMVVPELIIGSIGLAGSMIGTLYLYSRRSVKTKAH